LRGGSGVRKEHTTEQLREDTKGVIEETDHTPMSIVYTLGRTRKQLNMLRTINEEADDGWTFKKKGF